jgi:hypothetical protein
MAAVALQGRAAILEAPQNGEAGVKEWERSDDDREKKLRVCGDAPSIEIKPQECHAETQQGTSGIPHEDFRGREIECKESSASTE